MKPLIALTAIFLAASCAIGASRHTLMYRLQCADANQVAVKLLSEEMSKTPDIEVAAEPSTNSVVVKAPKLDVTRLHQRIRELDVR